MKSARPNSFSNDDIKNGHSSHSTPGIIIGVIAMSAIAFQIADVSLSWFNPCVSAILVVLVSMLALKSKQLKITSAPKSKEKEVEASVSGEEENFGLLLLTCAKAGDAEGAEKCLEDMCREGHKCSIVDYGNAIHACVRNGEVSCAERVMKKMQESKIEANVIIYNCMINICVKVGDPDRAESWLQEMIKEGVQPDNTSYISVLDARAKSGDIPRTASWLSHMLKNDIRAGPVSFAILARLYARHGDLDGAESWCEMMLSSADLPKTAAPVNHAVNVLIESCCERGDIPRAEAWIQRIVDLGIVPGLMSYSSVISACVRKGDIEKAKQLVQEMKDSGVEASRLYAMIESYEKMGFVANPTPRFTRYGKSRKTKLDTKWHWKGIRNKSLASKEEELASFSAGSPKFDAHLSMSASTILDTATSSSEEEN